ncbi:MAG: hypothetical protein U9M94_04420 [Patescibacteria group bacterium]|nr:hypothetical protein [Patescibacteria group bacterium]
MNTGFTSLSTELNKDKYKLELRKDYKSAFILKGFDYEKWTPIPNQLLVDSRISSGAKCFWQLLQALGDEKGHSYYGQKKLAKFFNKTIRTIQRYQVQLSKYGWLTVEPGTEYRSNNYYVIWPPGNTNPKWKSYMKKERIR